MAESKRISDPRIIQLLCQLIAQAGEHAFILVDRGGKLIWCNAGAERLFSTSLDAIVGRDFAEIFTANDQAAGIAGLEMAIAKSDAVSEDDRWHRRADGSTFWSSGALVQIKDPDSGELLGYGKILRDRTDLKSRFDLLSNQYEQLQEADRSKDQAMTKLSHELRNVIAGVRGALELLDTPLDNERLRLKFAELMRRQLGMIERLTEDLLDVKRAEAGKVRLACERVVLQRELRAIVQGLQARLAAQELTLQVLAPPADIVVNADPQRLQQIFGNILDNAIKYTPSGGRIWIKMTIEDTLAVTHIEDTGRGIPHDMLRSIFELFSQVDSRHSGGGLGVGLALVRELVVLHGGSVQAVSKGLGEGSEFSVRLPLADSEA